MGKSKKKSTLMKSITWIFSGIGVLGITLLIGLNNKPTAQQTSEGNNQGNRIKLRLGRILGE